MSVRKVKGKDSGFPLKRRLPKYEVKWWGSITAAARQASSTRMDVLLITSSLFNPLCVCALRTTYILRV